MCTRFEHMSEYPIPITIRSYSESALQLCRKLQEPLGRAAGLTLAQIYNTSPTMSAAASRRDFFSPVPSHSAGFLRLLEHSRQSAAERVRQFKIEGTSEREGDRRDDSDCCSVSIDIEVSTTNWPSITRRP